VTPSLLDPDSPSPQRLQCHFITRGQKHRYSIRALTAARCTVVSLFEDQPLYIPSMQACFVQESVLRNSTTTGLPRRTSFESISRASSASTKSSRNKDKNRMTFMSSFPSHLPSQHQSASYSRESTPQSPSDAASTPARSYFRNNRRHTQASTATQSSSFSKSSRFSRITSRSSSTSSSSTDSVKEERRVRRWGRKAVESLGRAFSAYPQGRSVGVVWYTGF
jgi:hypothetical protein